MEIFWIIVLTIINLWFTIYIYISKQSIKSFYDKELEKHKNKLQKELEDHKKQKETDFKIYSELIDLTRPFLSDPNLNYEEAKKMAEFFIIKYNNEILPFASKELISNVDEFLYNSTTKIAQENELTLALWKMISAIRKEQNLEPITSIRIHTVDLEQLRERYKD